MVSNMWNQAKMDHQDTDDSNTLLPTDKIGGIQAQMNDYNEQETVDTTIDFQAENQRFNMYNANKERYEHELNKIRFIFSSAKKMKDLQAALGFHHP